MLGWGVRNSDGGTGDGTLTSTVGCLADHEWLETPLSPSDSEGRGDEGSVLVEQECPVLHHVLPLVALISLSAFIQC